MQTLEGKYLINNRIFALIWRALVVTGCGFGLIPMMMYAEGTQLYCYFTMQSNIFVAILFVILLVGTIVQVSKKGAIGDIYHISPILQLAIIFFIQITFLVYATMLSGSGFSMGSFIAFANIALHYIVPLMALADWLMFMPHGKLNFKHAALWLAYPAAYVIFSFIRADLGKPFGNGSRFPYFFMDADLLGWHLVWICIAFFAAYYGLACLLVVIDRALAKKLSKTADTNNE